MRNVPVGFAHHKTMMPSYTMDGALEEMDRYEEDGELLGQLRRDITKLVRWEAGIISLSSRRMTTVIWL